MGCDYYYIGTTAIHLSENEDIGCLCTFPHNYEHDKQLDKDLIRSLAYLGASVVLARRNQKFNKNLPDITSYTFIPECLPDWIKKEIDKHLILE